MDEIKYIEVTDGDYTWKFRASVVAKNRAEYYASVDSDTTYDDEFKQTMEDDYELRDWFLNNMDWKDVAKNATLKEQPFKLSPDLSDEKVQSSVVVVGYDK